MSGAAGSQPMPLLPRFQTEQVVATPGALEAAASRAACRRDRREEKLSERLDGCPAGHRVVADEGNTVRRQRMSD